MRAHVRVCWCVCENVFAYLGTHLSIYLSAYAHTLSHTHTLGGAASATTPSAREQIAQAQPHIENLATRRSLVCRGAALPPSLPLFASTCHACVRVRTIYVLDASR